jgi:hypothetical protein
LSRPEDSSRNHAVQSRVAEVGQRTSRCSGPRRSSIWISGSAARALSAGLATTRCRSLGRCGHLDRDEPCVGAKRQSRPLACRRRQRNHSRDGASKVMGAHCSSRFRPSPAQTAEADRARVASLATTVMRGAAALRATASTA